MNADQLDKIVSDFIDFTKNSFNFMTTISGQEPQDPKPLFNFLEAQKKLFVETKTRGK